MERLTFNPSVQRGPVVVLGRGSRERPTGRPPARPAPAAHAKAKAAARERYDWDYLWMIAFTALLFFRPQDQVPPLAALHLSELTALAGLAAMAVRRLSTGETVAKINAEVIGVIALGGVILLTVPFSIWPGGSTRVFTDSYIKIILIFALMVTTLSSPKRLRQMTWLLIVSSGYVAARAVFDYVRGVNLVEGDRVRGAVGGMFENPNDLALNMVVFLAPALFIIIQERRASRRLAASGLAVLMLGAIVCTKSRSGFLGLLAMCAVVAYYMLRSNPGIVVAGVLASLMALPVMPSSFWARMDSILNAQEDPTGSREARLRLFNQGLQVFADNPITGIGAGQFQNYNEPGVTVEKWRVTHDVWLQVAAELGIFGFLAFAFLVARAFLACRTTLRLLRRPRRRPAAARFARSAPARASPHDDSPIFDNDADREIIDRNAKAMLAGLVGWFVCAMFASVAFNWTFYYVFALAVAGRDIVLARRATAAQAQPQPAAITVDVRKLAI